MPALDESAVTVGPEVFVHQVGTNIPRQSCTLLGIAHGKILIRSDRWIEPASRVSAMFAHLAFLGEVLYCTRKDKGYRTCIDLFSGDDQRRREPRLAVHQRGAVVALSDSRNATPLSGMLIDLAVSGMRLQVPHHVEAGTMIYVETESTLVAGEVRHCQAARNGGFEAGVQITDVLSDTGSRQNSPGVLKSIRRKLAEAVLGEPITTRRKLG